jgi:hypothetical protein
MNANSCRLMQRPANSYKFMQIHATEKTNRKTTIIFYFFKLCKT